MCAIAGIFSKSEGVDKQELERMCERMKLRGPDRGALYAGKQVGLGHRRLSVIDLSTGDQPMFSRDRNVVIVFNGEAVSQSLMRIKQKYCFLTGRFITSGSCGKNWKRKDRCL